MRSAALILTCLAALLLLPFPGAGAEQPNIIFIFADDLGWGDLGCYGNRSIKTPSLDKLAEQGTLFTQFYVNSGVCSPSRTAVMTGQFPARHRIHSHLASPAKNAERGMTNWLDPDVPMLTRLLRDAGYATAHFGKWHLGSVEGAPGPGRYGIDVHRTWNSTGPSWEAPDGPRFRSGSTAPLVDETIRFIEAHKDEPFYINLWTLIPHAPLDPSSEQMRPYRHYGPEHVPHAGTAPVYYAAVSGLDAEVGRLMDKLDELGLARKTLVMFSSDNGPEDILVRMANHSGIGSPGPLRGRKRSLYEGGVRVPFIVRWPGHVPAGRVDDESVVTAVDLMPTLCKLTGAEIPPGHSLDGEDRGGVLLGEPAARSKPIYWEWRFGNIGHVFYKSPRLAVRDGKWKLLMNPDGSRVELYDIPADPREMNNQATANPKLIQRLSKPLLEWHKTLPEGIVYDVAGKNDYPWPGRRPPTHGRRAPGAAVPRPVPEG